jgi:hypothetical protein
VFVDLSAAAAVFAAVVAAAEETSLLLCSNALAVLEVTLDISLTLSVACCHDVLSKSKFVKIVLFTNLTTVTPLLAMLLIV